MTTFVRTNIFLTTDERTLLHNLAIKRKISTAAVLREFVDKGLGLTAARTVHSHPAKTWESKRRK